MNVCVLGGDKRQVYLADEFIGSGHPTKVFANSLCYNQEKSLTDALSGSDIVILPYPLSPDGIFLNAPNSEAINLQMLFGQISDITCAKVFAGAVSHSVAEKAKECGIVISDYADCESLLLKNALCTAEGALEIAINQLPITIHGSKITVIGYGRIGRILSRILVSLGADVCAVARKNSDFANMIIDRVTPFDFTSIGDALIKAQLVFNTVPAPVLLQRELLFIHTDTKVIDLASAPGGIDHVAADKLGVNVICALSLPGKYSPKSAAVIIKDTVLDILAR